MYIIVSIFFLFSQYILFYILTIVYDLLLTTTTTTSIIITMYTTNSNACDPFCYYIILTKNLDLVISYYLYISLI